MVRRAGWLGRYAAVGALATAVDVVGFVALRGMGVALVPADVAALVVAAGLSLLLHRWVTLRDDPATRWIRYPEAFAISAIVAGAIDLAVLGAASIAWPDAAAKIVAVGAAAGVRLLAHRAFLFRRIRRHQGEAAGRPPVTGGPRLSVVVPAYREADRIATTVARLRGELARHVAPDGVEIVVVDDGSDDDTAGAAERAGADIVVTQPRNRGKGAALRAGVAAASGRVVAFTDADLSYEPVELVAFLTAVESGWDVAVGSRHHAATTTTVPARRLREVGSRVINLATHVLLVGQYRDTQCGIKALRRDVGQALFAQMRVDGFAFDVELFHLVERFELSLTELPVTVANSDRSTVRVVRDAVRLLADLVRIRRWGRAGAYTRPNL